MKARAVVSLAIVLVGMGSAAAVADESVGTGAGEFMVGAIEGAREEQHSPASNASEVGPVEQSGGTEPACDSSDPSCVTDPGCGLVVEALTVAGCVRGVD
ncbi:hypothetical protein, partial [Nocardioides dubius]|uniref:hypothetical protein n=1 Tax=Nocardioides dubius TaxID=317019 RepID=UPI0039E82EB9